MSVSCVRRSAKGFENSAVCDAEQTSEVDSMLCSKLGLAVHFVKKLSKVRG